MKIFVCFKQIPDRESRVAISSDGTGVDLGQAKWVISALDENAIEEALKIKERMGGDTLTIGVTVGPKRRATDAVRTALAMGLDEAILVDTPDEVDTATAARTLARVLATEGEIGLVIAGSVALDDHAASFPQQLAEHLGMPHITMVSELNIEGDTVTAKRVADGGALETVLVKRPAVVAATKGLNSPRLASPIGIMKAKKKPVKELSLAALDVAMTPKVSFSHFALPPEKPKVQMLDGGPPEQVRQLIDKLRNETKVL